EFDGVLNKPLPLVNKSVNELLAFADKLEAALKEAQSNPAGTLQLLDTKISEAFGVDPSTNLFVFSLDTNDHGTGDTADDSKILKLGLNLDAAFSDSLNVQVPNIPVAGKVFDLGGAAKLGVSASADFVLNIGIDLKDPSQVFIYDTTGLTGNLT